MRAANGTRAPNERPYEENVMRAANGTRAPNGRPYEEDGTRAMNGTRVADGRFYNWFISHIAPIQPDSGFCYIAFYRGWCYNDDGMFYHAVVLPECRYGGPASMGKVPRRGRRVPCRQERHPLSQLTLTAPPKGEPSRNQKGAGRWKNRKSSDEV